MSAEIFFDTNVLIYLLDLTDDAKRGRADSLVQDSLSRSNGCISYQVVQETLNILATKLGATAEEMRTMLDEILAPLWSVQPTIELYRRGLDLRVRYGYSFYDSLIVSAALEAGCTQLYTEDLQHGQRIGELTIVDPFRP